MSNLQKGILFAVSMLVMISISVNVINCIKLERAFSEEQLIQALSGTDKVIIGHVTVKDRGKLSDSLIIIKDPNNGIEVESDEGVVIKDCYFTSADQYNMTYLDKYVDLFDKVTLISYNHWYRYDSEEWEVRFWADKNEIEYKFNVEDPDLNAAINKMAGKIEQRMKECK